MIISEALLDTQKEKSKLSFKTLQILVHKTVTLFHYYYYSIHSPCLCTLARISSLKCISLLSGNNVNFFNDQLEISIHPTVNIWEPVKVTILIASVFKTHIENGQRQVFMMFEHFNMRANQHFNMRSNRCLWLISWLHTFCDHLTVTKFAFGTQSILLKVFILKVSSP